MALKYIKNYHHLMSGLRLAAGIDKRRFRQIAGYALDAIAAKSKREMLVREGLAWESQAGFGLTQNGRMVLDASIELLLAEQKSGPQVM